MDRALSAAATSLQAHQTNIERIANDLANANTDAYKRSRMEFEDLLYQTIEAPGGAQGAATQSPVGVQVGMGVKVGSVHKVFEQGPVKTTYRPYDLMIEGNGFFSIQLPTGEVAYTRRGSFHRGADGVLKLSSGLALVPQITVPPNALQVKISQNGQVQALLPGNEEALLGQIQLTRFQNAEGLLARGGGLFLQTTASGAPVQGVPSEDGFGSLQQGALEGSNVNVPSSMVDMITTQRAYEMSTKVMSAVDQMLKATSNLR